MIDIMSFFRSKKSSKKTASQIAKERLKLVLIHDRSDCNAELLENIRKDIMDVLSKYMEIDMDALDIQISTTRLDDDDQEVPALYANIPIKTLKQINKDDDKKENKKEEKKEDKKETKKDKEEKNKEDKKEESKEDKKEDK